MTDGTKTPAKVVYTIAPYTSQPNQVTTISATGMTLEANGNNIKQDGINLVVWGHEKLSIVFNVTDGSAQPCSVVGIAISPDGSTDLSKKAAFPSAEINNVDLSLQLKDHDPSQASYEFYLLAQNGTGNLGLIDPLITNQ